MSNRLLTFVFVVTGLFVLIMFASHNSRKDPSVSEVPLVAAEGGVIEPEILQRQYQFDKKPLPRNAQPDHQIESRSEWQMGYYEVLPSDPAIVIVANSFEQKSFMPREAVTDFCRFDARQMCVRGYDFEFLFKEGLPVALHPNVQSKNIGSIFDLNAGKMSESDAQKNMNLAIERAQADALLLQKAAPNVEKAKEN